MRGLSINPCKLQSIKFVYTKLICTEFSQQMVNFMRECVVFDYFYAIHEIQILSGKEAIMRSQHCALQGVWAIPTKLAKVRKERLENSCECLQQITANPQQEQDKKSPKWARRTIVRQYCCFFPAYVVAVWLLRSAVDLLWISVPGRLLWAVNFLFIFHIVWLKAESAKRMHHIIILCVLKSPAKFLHVDCRCNDSIFRVFCKWV